MCKSWCEALIGLVIVVFALWKTNASQWIVVIAAIILILHSFVCKKCFSCAMPVKPAKRR